MYRKLINILRINTQAKRVMNNMAGSIYLAKISGDV